MADRDIYRRIIELTRDVSRAEPDPEEVRMAVQSMRDRLAPARPARKNYWRRKVVLVSSGIAAAVGIGFSIVMLVSFPQSATAAAENLNRSAEATNAYKGWVHVRPHANEDATSPPTTQRIVERNVVMHFNTADGTFGLEFEMNGIRSVVLSQPAKQQQKLFSAATQQIHLDNLNEDSASMWFKQIAAIPVQLADVLAQMKKDGLMKVNVKESKDGEFSRFDLTFDGDPAKAPERYREMVSEPRTIWTEPKTGLIRKMQTRTGGRAVIAEYTYGKPEIQDIYDLGVPRDAQVIDVRKSTPLSPPPALASQPAERQETVDASIDLNALQTRIDGRFEKGFGDYVAVLCEETVHDRPQPMRREGRIGLYAREGIRAHETSYLAAPAGVFMGLLGFPPGWPTPKLEDLLPMLDRVATTSGHMSGEVTDGHEMWRISPKLDPKPWATIVKSSPPKSINKIMSIAGEIWPRLSSGELPEAAVAIGLGVPKLETLRDPAHPTIIGIRETREYNLKPGGFQMPHKRQIVVYWIDPSRDDMPIETVTRTYGLDKGETLTWSLRLRYEDHAQLPDGSWYPTRWQLEKTTMREDVPPKQRVSRRAYTLQIFPGAKLDAQWYGDPQQRKSMQPKK